MKYNLRSTRPANKPTYFNWVLRYNNPRIVISGTEKIEPRTGMLKAKKRGWIKEQRIEKSNNKTDNTNKQKSHSDYL